MVETKEKNIKDKTDKAVGNVDKTISSLNERPYGKHAFKAALLTTQGLMLSGMLTNADIWINITEADITKPKMPDTMQCYKYNYFQFQEIPAKFLCV